MIDQQVRYDGKDNIFDALETFNLTTYQKELILEAGVTSVGFAKLYEKTTVCLLKVENGFEVIGTSACVNPRSYKWYDGCLYALRDALTQLDVIIGFAKQQTLHSKSV